MKRSEIKFFLRNHKHEPFLSMFKNVISTAPAVYHWGEFFSQSRRPYRPSANISLITSGKTGLDRRMIARVELTLHIPFTYIFNLSYLWCVMMSQTLMPHKYVRDLFRPNQTLWRAMLKLSHQLLWIKLEWDCCFLVPLVFGRGRYISVVRASVQ